MKWLKDPQRAGALFQNWQETMIWSCLQGMMGHVYGDNAEFPRSAIAVLGDFCFLAGKPLEGLLAGEEKLRGAGFRILVPQNEKWAELIEEFYGDRAKEGIRYAFRKDGDIFDRKWLKKIAGFLPEGYSLRMMDEQCFTQCRAEEWSRDLVSQYTAYEEYEKLALGVAVMREGQVVAGASAYSRYRDGIEIEIDTKSSHRRKGLASACGAGLILECLKRELYPSWDAQNPVSAALARKLGYRFSHTYRIYEVAGSRTE